MVGRVVRRGLYVPCWLGPPCKVKSDRFAVSRSYEGLIYVCLYKILSTLNYFCLYHHDCYSGFMQILDESSFI